MLTREPAHDIFDRLRKHCTADEIEMLISGGRSALTRFANNTIHQNVAEEQYQISVRVSLAGRTARATTNKHDDGSLQRVVESAEALARVQQPDPDLLPMPSPDEVNQDGAEAGVAVVQRYFEHTAQLTPPERAAAVAQMVATAKKHGLTAAGIFSSAEAVEGIFNSRGLAEWYEQTLAEVSITMLGETSSGWQKGNSPNVAQLDPAKLAEVAAQKAIAARNPGELAPGKYTVILEPAAVLDAVGFMFWDFGGSALLEQRSFLNGRMGTQLFGDNITILDDVYHPLQTGMPFDGEGMKRHRLKLVENGTVRAVTYARSSAKRMRDSELAGEMGPITPTGHGFPLPNEIGEAPLNIVFAVPEGKSQSVEQMIASTEHGILVTRLWYIREVDPYEKILTGMTRDGTFLVRGGELQGGIRNLRFNESLVRMLCNVEAMGEPVRASGEESMDMVVPAMMIREFNFTESTMF
ncbi:MAG TPA: TldD/PmbA family protein [Candidatus Binatia bacterium]|nr:TldD/PmbA family protein [Candidatus Binatia bacterium]